MTEQTTPLADPMVWLWRSVEAASLASLAADGAHRAAVTLERACGDHLDARQQAFLRATVSACGASCAAADQADNLIADTWNMMRPEPPPPDVPPAIRRIGNAIVDPANDVEPTIGLFGHQPPNEDIADSRVPPVSLGAGGNTVILHDETGEEHVALPPAARRMGMRIMGVNEEIAADQPAPEPAARRNALRDARQEGYREGVRDAQQGKAGDLARATEAGRQDIVDALGGNGMSPDEFIRVTQDYRATAAQVWSQWHDARISDDNDIVAILRAVTAEMTTKVELPPALDRDATMAQIAYMASLVWVYDRHLAAAQEEAANGGG